MGVTTVAWFNRCLLPLCAIALTGCYALKAAERNYAAALAGTAVLATTPSAEIEQVYYLGSFDPQEQLPPAIYRIRVRGQSSILNSTRFASGWVPAEIVDSLTRSLSVDARTGQVSVGGTATTTEALADTGRGLVLFGPEGFREAPRGHRLVILMGSNPEIVEQAFSTALGSIAQIKFGEAGGELDRKLLAQLTTLHADKERLKSVINPGQEFP